MTPQQVNAMSMWQFMALVAGATEEGSGLSEAEAEDIWAWLEAGK